MPYIVNKIMIVLKNLVKHYDNGLVKALNGISININQGELISIMGPSGCGKSTLLNIIGTLDSLTDGEISIFGKNISEYQPFNIFRSEYIGFVFQFHHLLPSLTLIENVEIPMYAIHISKKSRREKAKKLLFEMGLDDRMNFFPTKISGGERQRVAVARALVNSPKVILADEPTGNLDTSTGEKILDFLIKLCREKNITLIMATHNPDRASTTDRVVYLKDGLIEED